jgi:hypothetical protein
LVEVVDVLKQCLYLENADRMGKVDAVEAVEVFFNNREKNNLIKYKDEKREVFKLTRISGLEQQGVHCLWQIKPLQGCPLWQSTGVIIMRLFSPS